MTHFGRFVLVCIILKNSFFISKFAFLACACVWDFFCAPVFHPCFFFRFLPFSIFSHDCILFGKTASIQQRTSSRALRLEITLCGFLFHRPASFEDGMRMAQVILRWHSTVILRWHSHISYTGSSHSGGHFQIHRSLLRIMWIFRRSGSSSLFFFAQWKRVSPSIASCPTSFSARFCASGCKHAKVARGCSCAIAAQPHSLSRPASRPLAAWRFSSRKPPPGASEGKVKIFRVVLNPWSWKYQMQTSQHSWIVTP